MIFGPQIWVTGFCLGAIGGLSHYLYWLISAGKELNGYGIRTLNKRRNFRASMLTMALITGGIAGVVISIWYSQEIAIGKILHEKVYVYEFLAGLAGRSFLDYLNKK